MRAGARSGAERTRRRGTQPPAAQRCASPASRTGGRCCSRVGCSPRSTCRKPRSRSRRTCKMPQWNSIPYWTNAKFPGGGPRSQYVFRASRSRESCFSGRTYCRSMASKQVLRVCVTGAAGQIAYSLLPHICLGRTFGPNTGIILHLLDIERAQTVRSALRDPRPPGVPAPYFAHRDPRACALPQCTGSTAGVAGLRPAGPRARAPRDSTRVCARYGRRRSRASRWSSRTAASTCSSMSSPRPTPRWRSRTSTSSSALAPSRVARVTQLPRPARTHPREKPPRGTPPEAS